MMKDAGNTAEAAKMEQTGFQGALYVQKYFKGYVPFLAE
jgi:hypothetical protein